MFYCNLCGKPTKILETSHTLDKNGKRTGKILRTCTLCHKNYHKIRKDFSRWGKLGVKARRKNGTFNMSLVGKGFPFVRKGRKKEWP